MSSVEIRHQMSYDGSLWQNEVVPAEIGCSGVYRIHFVREGMSFYDKIVDFFIWFEEKVPWVGWSKDLKGGLLSWFWNEILLEFYWLAVNLLRCICLEFVHLEEMYLFSV